MTTETIDRYGALTAPDTLTIRRVLPGPAERIWAYLTDGELRRKWLAAGSMEERVGAAFTLTWRNDELTSPPGAKPDGFGGEHSMASTVTECDPPRRLAFTWGDSGSTVEIDLEPEGEDVLLTLVHRSVPEGDTRRMIGAGWLAHLDVLESVAKGKAPTPFWDSWTALKAEYDARF
ncbi:SRPBCC family protein [Chachezhania antarctica]|uniref:SRPBCC family protein n=1 Tax=Chachezhania antarctica TaxID=2340860 RepID=UPI001968E2CD|nr:SRPBCC family protein [Chachezhania antarctica]